MKTLCLFLILLSLLLPSSPAESKKEEPEQKSKTKIENQTKQHTEDFEKPEIFEDIQLEKNLEQIHDSAESEPLNPSQDPKSE